jgi:hypothetical protein
MPTILKKEKSRESIKHKNVAYGSPNKIPRTRNSKDRTDSRMFTSNTASQSQRTFLQEINGQNPLSLTMNDTAESV